MISVVPENKLFTRKEMCAMIAEYENCCRLWFRTAAEEFADTQIWEDSDPDLVSGVKKIRREDNDF